MGTVRSISSARTTATRRWSQEDMAFEAAVGPLRTELHKATSKRDSDHELPGGYSAYTEELRAMRVRAALASADIDPAASQAERDREDLLSLLDDIVESWLEKHDEHVSELKAAEEGREAEEARCVELERQLGLDDNALRAALEEKETFLSAYRSRHDEHERQIASLKSRLESALAASDEAARREAGALRGETAAREQLAAETERADRAQLATLAADAPNGVTVDAAWLRWLQGCAISSFEGYNTSQEECRILRARVAELEAAMPKPKLRARRPRKVTP